MNIEIVCCLLLKKKINDNRVKRWESSIATKQAQYWANPSEETAKAYIRASDAVPEKFKLRPFMSTTKVSYPAEKILGDASSWDSLSTRGIAFPTGVGGKGGMISLPRATTVTKPDGTSYIRPGTPIRPQLDLFRNQHIK